MADVSTFNSVEMDIPRNQSLGSHPIRKLGNGTLNFNLEILTADFIVLLKLSCLLCVVCNVIYCVITFELFTRLVHVWISDVF